MNKITGFLVVILLVGIVWIVMKDDNFSQEAIEIEQKPLEQQKVVLPTPPTPTDEELVLEEFMLGIKTIQDVSVEKADPSLINILLASIDKAKKVGVDVSEMETQATQLEADIIGKVLHCIEISISRSDRSSLLFLTDGVEWSCSSPHYKDQHIYHPISLRERIYALKQNGVNTTDLERSLFDSMSKLYRREISFEIDGLFVRSEEEGFYAYGGWGGPDLVYEHLSVAHELGIPVDDLTEKFLAKMRPY